MKKTDIIDVISRKLVPFMVLFGFYLVSYGHVSPGGGFQGGVVIASGIILLALARDVTLAEAYFPTRRLRIVEASAFIALLLAGSFGVVAGTGYLGNFGRPELPGVPTGPGFMLLLNMLIGIKVGVGVSLVCIHLFRESKR
jgi:multicomponent Na+:H+ antiporter subunit B